ncbi:hypothetical protein INS49_014208 [Diaporthe citri]|uniref:uncharacterized protein n=1 Tax=Diaporthe citri TaxID=83186 RepID=UPI001C81D847|nr:uncharacterized protein INS49_014208 [Diaporthe citri]KAG6358324.1 hypothetical protein INS49_014208 [Diaporthe citri]
MAQQASEPTTRQVRQLFGKLYDQAAGLAESLRPCRCGARGHARDDQDLNAVVQELLPVRQRVGGCICGPPCDGTSVDHASDEFLEEMLAGLLWDYNVLHENLVPCDCADKPEVVEDTPVPVVEQNPPPFLRLPLEIRNIIYWLVLGPPPPARENGSRGFVRVVQRLLGPAEDIMDRALQRPRSSIDMGGEPPHGLTFEFQDERLQTENHRGRWALLFVNRQIGREAEIELWRRIFVDGVVLSIMPDVNLPGDDYYGVLAAWTWFHNYHDIYLQQIRRLQLTLKEPARGPLYLNDARTERTKRVEKPYPLGRSNGVEFLNPVLDTVAGDLPNLQELSVTIGGLPPDMRFGSPWEEGHRLQGRLRSSRPWVTRLQSIRGLRRLRLRFIISPLSMQEPDSASSFFDDDPSAVNNDFDVRRTVHFVSTMRGSMLVNGQALGDRHIRRRATRRVEGETTEVIVVECDDSWDEETGEHIHHREHREGDDPDDRTWDDGDLNEAPPGAWIEESP